jgi:predicted nucleic acid-binding Zn ribbon protein
VRIHNRAARCLECGEPFLQLRADKLTCSERCKKRRQRRLADALERVPISPAPAETVTR